METNSTAASVIRSNAKWPIVITSILMAITIGSYGVSELINSKSVDGDIYLKNWKTKITAKELRDLFNQDIPNMLEFQYRYGLKEEQARNFLSSMVVQSALQIKDAEKRKLDVTKQEIIDKISADRRFADDKGKFDPKKYDEGLGYMYRSNSNIEASRVLYEKKTRNDILKEKLRNEIIKGVKPTEQEIKEEFHNKSDTLEYEYVTIEVDAKKAPEPSAEEIKKVYDENTKGKNPEYMTEKMLKAKYIFFPYSKYEGEAPKEEEIQAYYDKNKSEFLEKEAEATEPATTPKEPKYKPLKSVHAEISQKLIKEKSKTKAHDVTDKIHTEMSKIKNDKNEVDIVKGFETMKPENGVYGETTYFTKTEGANELGDKYGDIKSFRTQAFANAEKLTLQRINLDKGILFYFAYKADAKLPVLKSLEECKAKIVSELKEDKSWEIAENKAKDLVKLCEAEGWEKTIKSKELTATTQSVVISEAAGKHNSIVSSILDQKIKLGKCLYVQSKSDLPEKEFYVIMYKNRTPASDEKYKKDKDDIATKLDSSKKSKIWSEYVSELPDKAGMPKDEEKKK